MTADDGELLIYEWEKSPLKAIDGFMPLACHFSACAFFSRAATSIWSVVLKNDSLQHMDVAQGFNVH